MGKRNEGKMPFLQHLEVFRWHLARSFSVILFFGIICYVGKSILFDVIIFGPKNPSFITYRLFCLLSRTLNITEVFCLEKMPFEILNTKMAGQFSTHIWVSIIAGFIIAFPYVLWEIWRFVSLGLHKNERKYSKTVLFYAAILFFIGVLFGYYLIVPLSVQFLGGYNVSNKVTNFIDLVSYVSTVSTITLSTGVIFELPITVYLLARLGILSLSWMKKYRRHAFVVILILSAIITPPDISSQVLVALPLAVLYEVSIWICARTVKQQQIEWLKRSRTEGK